jgi:hypothetical protein
MKRDGRFVDPLRIELPPAEPIPEKERPAFVAVRDRELALLGGRSGSEASTRVASGRP